MTCIGVIGAGAFGTALAISLARDGRDVRLFARSRSHAERMQETGSNQGRLPGFPFPDTLQPTSDIRDLDDCRAVLMCVPLQQLDNFFLEHTDWQPRNALVNCAKGIDQRTGEFGTEIIRRHRTDVSVAVLTGPSFAVDIAAGLPTALTLACEEAALRTLLQNTLSTANIRLYSGADVVGAELGGALKNVIALAAGMTIGAGFGESARAAIIGRGFSEMKRVAASLGADPGTLGGMSGLGDLVLTCTSEKSRNFSAGGALGRGKAPDASKTTEGIATAQAAVALGEKYAIDLPLMKMVSEVVSGKISIDLAKDVLLARPLRKEE